MIANSRILESKIIEALLCWVHLGLVRTTMNSPHIVCENLWLEVYFPIVLQDYFPFGKASWPVLSTTVLYNPQVVEIMTYTSSFLNPCKLTCRDVSLCFLLMWLNFFLMGVTSHQSFVVHRWLVFQWHLATYLREDFLDTWPRMTVAKGQNWRQPSWQSAYAKMSMLEIFVAFFIWKKHNKVNYGICMHILYLTVRYPT